MHQVRFVLEDNVGLLDDAPPFDVNGLIRVDQNVAHRRVVQQRFEWPKPEYFIENVVRKTVAVGSAERRALFPDQLQNDCEQPLASTEFIRLNGSQFFQIHAAYQFVMNGSFECMPRRVGKPDSRFCRGHGSRLRCHVHRNFRCVCFRYRGQCSHLRNANSFLFSTTGFGPLTPFTIRAAQRASAWLNSDRRWGGIGSPSLIARSNSK